MSSVSNATHEEWPPKRAYSTPAHGVEPRTPLNTTRIPPDMGGEDTHAVEVLDSATRAPGADLPCK